jgi:hypothetical protein
MVLRVTRRHCVVLARTLHPEYRQIVQTYVHNQDVELVEVPYAASGQIDLAQLESQVDAQTAAVLPAGFSADRHACRTPLHTRECGDQDLSGFWTDATDREVSGVPSAAKRGARSNR